MSDDGTGRDVQQVDAPFGRLLREHRRRNGLSQQALAEVAGLSVDAIAALERGRRRAPRAFTVRVLAEALALDAAQSAALHDAASGSAPGPPPEVPFLRVPVGPLVGRADDLAALVRLLGPGGPRAITLTGPGGIGKTRLALELAHAVSSSVRDGVRWLSLEGVADSEAVPAVVAGGLGVRQVEADPVRAAAEHLADRAVLLVIDNCEQVVAACAALVAALLARTTGLRVLATSREQLAIPGEAVWPVLPLDGPGDDCPPELLDTYAASSLFLHHARQLDPAFAVAADDVPRLVALCRRLDGLPLAIELAAARTTAMSVAEVADALEHGLEVLRSRTRTTSPRHQTLLGTLAWSYDLLDPEERLLLARLSVFADGCTREAAVAVCVGGPIGPHDVLPIVEALVAKSLVVRRDHAGAARVALLDTVRRYAADRLHEIGGVAELDRRHAAYFCELAERAGARLELDDEPRWLDLVDAEAANLRQAITWATAHADAQLALRTAGALWRWCYLRGHYAEGRAWLDGALELGADCPPEVRVKALTGAALLAFLQCEYDLSRRQFERALGAYRELGDPTGEAWALQRLGAIAREQGRYDDAVALHGESLAIVEQHHGPDDARRDLGFLVFVHWLRGDLDEAARRGTEVLEILRPRGDGERLVWAMLNLGAVALYRGNHDGAQSLLAESLTVADEIGYREGTAWALNLLGLARCRAGDHPGAEELLRDSIELHRALGDEWRTASVLEALASCAVELGDAPRAARLLGAASAVRARIGVPIPACEVPDHERTVAAAQAELGADRLESARVAGSAIPLDRLVAVAAREPGTTDVRVRRQPPVSAR